MEGRNKDRTTINFTPELRRAIQRHKQTSKFNVSTSCEDHIYRVLVLRDSDALFLGVMGAIEGHQAKIEQIKSRFQAETGESYEERKAKYFRGYEDREAERLLEIRGREAEKQKVMVGILAKSEGRTGDELEQWLGGRKGELKAHGLTIDDAIEYSKRQGVKA